MGTRDGGVGMPELTWERVQDLTFKALEGGITGFISLFILVCAGAAAYYKYKDKYKQLMIDENKRQSQKAQADNAADNAEDEKAQTEAGNALKRLLTKLDWQRKIRDIEARQEKSKK